MPTITKAAGKVSVEKNDEVRLRKLCQLYKWEGLKPLLRTEF